MLQQAFRGEAPPPTTVPAGDPASGTAYELSSFSIDYPWPEGSTQSPGARAARVRFEATWLNSTFPGRAECQLTLLAADGASVGAATFFASYLARSSQAPPVVVEVSARPETARGTCGPGTYPPGEGYVFPEITLAESDDPEMTAVEFEAAWADAIDPTWRECRLEALLVDGTSVSQMFTLSVPDGTRMTREIDAPPSKVASVSVKCTEVS